MDYITKNEWDTSIGGREINLETIYKRFRNLIVNIIRIQAWYLKSLSYKIIGLICLLLSQVSWKTVREEGTKVRSIERRCIQRRTSCSASWRWCGVRPRPWPRSSWWGRVTWSSSGRSTLTRVEDTWSQPCAETWCTPRSCSSQPIKDDIW